MRRGATVSMPCAMDLRSNPAWDNSKMGAKFGLLRNPVTCLRFSVPGLLSGPDRRSPLYDLETSVPASRITVPAPGASDNPLRPLPMLFLDIPTLDLGFKNSCELR